ncbi:hypothetical protein, partial [Aneurinibacillus danicus]|uniref:hypothetical protein n=1 Tax=Aneurinibacillus danicus TaxID=267746 RepID=UPI001C3FCDE1
VIDTPKQPKVDGIACPETDEYNVLVTILKKEKGHLPFCATAPTVTRKMSHPKKHMVIVSNYKLIENSLTGVFS